MNNDLNKVAEDIGYNIGSYLVWIALWVFVVVCIIVAVIALVQYYNTRKGEGSIITIVTNTWKRMKPMEKGCTIAVLVAIVVAVLLYVFPSLWGLFF